MTRYLCLSVFICGSLFSQYEPILKASAEATTLEQNLRKLTDEVGGRRSGSPAMGRAVAWVVETFRKAGVDEVHTEKFTMPSSWAEGATRLEILAPATFRARAVSVGWSPAIPAPGVEAPIVDGADGAHLGPEVKGALVLIHSGTLQKWEDLFGEYMRAPAIIDQAVRGGAKAILWMSTRERGLLYRHQNSLDGKLDRLPQVIIAREDALRLARLLQSSPPRRVRARLVLPNVMGGPVQEENVVAEIRGREKPDEIVILGAHLDSWDLGAGALDNGCDAALVIEAARVIRAVGPPPRRTVRFALFSGEEQGMLGSWAYAKVHRGEMDRIRGVVIFDTGTGRFTGYSLGGRADIHNAVTELLKPVESWNAGKHTPDAFVGTDNLDFLLEGVPTLVASQEESNYLENYHASSDTFDKVDMTALKRHVALAALTVYGIADRVEPLGKRQTRREIEALMKETGLDQQMKVLGLWKMWEKGARGRR